MICMGDERESECLSVCDNRSEQYSASVRQKSVCVCVCLKKERNKMCDRSECERECERE